MNKMLKRIIALSAAAVSMLACSLGVCADSVNSDIDKGYVGICETKYYSSDWFHYDSSWSRWEGVSDVSQFKDGNGNMYFAYPKDDTLVVDRLNTDMTTKNLFKIKKAMPKVGTVIADKSYIYVVWGAKSGKTSGETAIKVCKYDSTGKEIGSVSYTRNDLDAVIPLDDANCDAVISNGVLYCVFSIEMYSGHQRGTQVAVNISDMSKTKGARSFWCSHCFGQRAVVDRNGEVWYALHGDSYPRTFLICGPKGNNEIFHFYCSSSASSNMYILNQTNAEIGGLCETSNGMFFIGMSVKGMTEKEYNSQPYNIFITSADGSFKLDGAESRSGICKGNSYTDTNIKWLTDYTKGNEVTDVTAVSTDQDTIVVLWEENYKNTYYMILDSRGNISQKKTPVKGLSFNTCEMPLYKDGCLYWLASEPRSSNKQGTYIYKLTIGKVKSPVTVPSVEKVSCSTTKTSIQIKWGKVSKAEGYVIEQYKNGKWVRIAKLSKDSASYTVKNLSSGTKYRFRIKPYMTVDGETYYASSKNYAMYTKKG